MNPLGEFAFAILFGTVGFYTAMVSFDSFFKSKARKDIGLALAGLFIAALGVALVLL